MYVCITVLGFPDSSADKESACNAGEPGLILGLGRTPGEGVGYPLQCSWAFLVPRLVKSPPAEQEAWVRSLGWEDPLEEGVATCFSILVWRIPMDQRAWQATVHGGHKESDLTGRLSTAQHN